MNKSLAMLFAVIVFSVAALAVSGQDKKAPLPSDYGRVVINAFS